MEECNEKQLKGLASIYVKIGLFFSKCDGDFAQSEKELLESYLKNVDESLKPYYNPKDLIEEESKKHPSFEEIVNETNEFLAYFDENERAAVKSTFAVLIDKIINVDGKIHPNETKYFELWKKQVI